MAKLRRSGAGDFVRRGASRSALGVVDQAVSSLGNILLTLAVASRVSADSFGRFALTYVAYVFAVGLGRAILLEPLAVRGAEGRDSTGASQDKVLTSAMIVGTTLGLLLFCVAPWVSREAAVLVAVFAALLPWLLAQDCCRYIAFSRGNPALALRADAVWLFFLAVLAAGVVVTGHDNAVTLLLAWGLSGIMSWIYAMFSMGLRPSKRPGLFDRREQAITFSYGAEYLGAQGSMQAVYVVITGLVGLLAIGALRGAQTLLGPLNTLLTGLTAVGLVELGRLQRSSPSALGRAVAVVSFGLAAVVVVGTLIIDTIASRFGEVLLGATWPQAQHVMWPAAMAMAGNALILGPWLGLRVLAALRASFWCRMAGAVLQLVTATVVAFITRDMVLTVWAISGSVLVSSIHWAAVFRSEYSGRRRSAREAR